ncbi:hypothetical protein AtNW77_Chr4g0315791 [Arabidopsis thaliana]
MLNIGGVDDDIERLHKFDNNGNNYKVGRRKQHARVFPMDLFRLSCMALSLLWPP